jgi:hypothetical protein
VPFHVEVGARLHGYPAEIVEARLQPHFRAVLRVHTVEFVDSVEGIGERNNVADAIRSLDGEREAGLHWESCGERASRKGQRNAAEL